MFGMKQLASFLAIALLLVGWAAPAALAEVTFLKEADQWVYQAQTTLSDTEGRTWEVTALKLMEERSQGLSLRLVTQFPSVQLDAVQPLTLSLPSGQQLTARNITGQQFTGSLPDPNTGQYDIQPLLPQIKSAQSLRLYLPTQRSMTQRSAGVTLQIPAEVLEEWATVGSCDYIICSAERGHDNRLNPENFDPEESAETANSINNSRRF